LPLSDAERSATVGAGTGRVAQARAALHLAVDARIPAILTGLLAAPVLAANGGYFPTSWGWTALALGWLAALGVLLKAPPRPTPAQWLFLGGLFAFALWLVVSMAWTSAPTQTPLEVERLLVYLAGALAVLTLVRREHVSLLLGALGIGIALVCLYALATHLFPDRLGGVGGLNPSRLSTPVGYWNGLGLVAAMGIVLALVFSTQAVSWIARALAAAAGPVLACTLYFTFSRGAWIALFAGLCVLLAVERRRLQLLVTSVPIVAVAAIAVWLSSREEALTHARTTVDAAARAGHRLAPLILLLAAAAGLFAVGAKLLAHRWEPPVTAVRTARWALVSAAIAVMVAVTVEFGSPVTIARHAYDSFVGPAPVYGANLNGRLFSLSSTRRTVKWRIAVDAFGAHPAGGIGAGAYEQYWLRHRTDLEKVRDAHSLYVETLAETGVVGLVLLLAALGAPFVAISRARRHPLGAAAFGGYVTFLVHAAVDWDWELAGVTLCALLCAGAVLLAARTDAGPRTWRIAPAVLGSLLAVAALVGLIGNLALSSSRAAVRDGNWKRAASEARRADTWAPWSSEPLDLLGRAQLGLGHPAAARETFRRAIARSPGDWSLWFDLARASSGSERVTALKRAKQLDPLEPAVDEFAQEPRR
jgi:hypothetical protein